MSLGSGLFFLPERELLEAGSSHEKLNCGNLALSSASGFGDAPRRRSWLSRVWRRPADPRTL